MSAKDRFRRGIHCGTSYGFEYRTPKMVSMLTAAAAATICRALGSHKHAAIALTYKTAGTMIAGVKRSRISAVTVNPSATMLSQRFSATIPNPLRVFEETDDASAEAHRQW